jgi:hypothetical protein
LVRHDGHPRAVLALLVSFAVGLIGLAVLSAISLVKMLIAI